MVGSRGCNECDRLWRQYSSTSDELARLAKDEQQAMAEANLELANSIERRIDAVDRLRAEARKRVIEHQWAAHSTAESTGTAPARL